MTTRPPIKPSPHHRRSSEPQDTHKMSLTRHQRHHQPTTISSIIGKPCKQICVMATIAVAIVINLLIISQPTKCDTSQLEHHLQQHHQLVIPPQLPLLQQQLDTNRIKSTVRQLIKTTSNYLHNIKLANQLQQQDKHSYQPGRYSFASLNDNNNNNNKKIPFLEVQNSASANHHQYLQAEANQSSQNATRQHQLLPAASNHKLADNRFQTTSSQTIGANFNELSSINDQNYTQTNHGDKLSFVIPKDPTTATKIAHNHMTVGKISNSTRNNNNNNFTLNDFIQMAASNYIATSSDGKSMNLSPPYESMSKDQDVHITQPNKKFTLAYPDDMEIIGMSTNQSRLQLANNTGEYNQYGGTHANISGGGASPDYIGGDQVINDQQVSSSDQRLDYEIIDDGEHLVSEQTNINDNNNDATSRHRHRPSNQRRRQYRMYDGKNNRYLTGRRNNNNRNYTQDSPDSHRYKPLYPIVARNKQQPRQKHRAIVKQQNYLDENPTSYRQSNYSENQYSIGNDNFVNEQLGPHQPDEAMTNPASVYYDGARVDGATVNHTDQPSHQVIEDENSGGDQLVYQTIAPNEQSPPMMENPEERPEESFHKDRMVSQEQSDSPQIVEEQEQPPQAQPTVGETVVAPQLPIQYDTEIHMPPEGYYDDYYKPPLNNNSNNHTGSLGETKLESGNLDTGFISPVYNNNGSVGVVSASQYDDNSSKSRFEAGPNQHAANSYVLDQYKNHRYNNLRAFDSSNQESFPGELDRNRYHQDDNRYTNQTGEMIDLDHRYPKLEYYQDHAKMSSNEQRFQSNLDSDMGDSKDGYIYGGRKKNHRKRNKQGTYNNQDGYNNRDHQKVRAGDRANMELINDEGPIIFGLRGNNESSLIMSPDINQEKNGPFSRDDYQSSSHSNLLTTNKYRHQNDNSERLNHHHKNSDSDQNDPHRPYEWSSAPDSATTTDQSIQSNYEVATNKRRHVDKGNLSMTDYNGPDYRRGHNNSNNNNNHYNNSSSGRPISINNSYDREPQRLKNLILARPTNNEPTTVSTIGTMKKLKEMKPQPDRNELMNELLTALDRVKMAIYKLQPLTAKVNAMYRKSVTPNARDGGMDNNKAIYAKTYPPGGDFDDTYDRVHSNEKMSSAASVPNPVYVPAPLDVLEAYRNQSSTRVERKATPTGASTKTTSSNTVQDGQLTSGQQRISNRMLTNIEIHASESTDHIPTIVATGVGRRQGDGSATGDLEVTSGESSTQSDLYGRDGHNKDRTRSKLSYEDSAAPDFVPEDQINQNEPLFGYRITIYQSPEDYDVPRIKESDPRMDMEEAGEEDTSDTDQSLERRSYAESGDNNSDNNNNNDSMVTSESSIMEQEIQADASESKKKYESSGEGGEEEKESGKEAKKSGKKSGKMKKGESKKKKHSAHTKKKKEYKKIKQNKGILSKEKKSMHRDKHIAAHDRGAAKEKALKERTQIEFFEREQIVDDEYEKGKKSLMKAGWQTGAESKKAMKMSANSPEPVIYVSKDGSKSSKHASYDKGHENKIGRANMHTSNKYEKKNMEHKGKKFKGWREKGYKIITETEFIDRGSLHDSAYKKRDKGAAHHKKYKKQEASSEGHHGTIMEESKKKSGKQEKKFDSKEHDSKKHKHKESNNKKKKHMKKEMENEFENDHDHEESVMTATVTPRGNSNETVFETTLTPLYYPVRYNQSETFDRLISGSHDEKIYNFMNEPLQIQRLNDSVLPQMGRLDSKANTTNAPSAYQKPSLLISNHGKSILSSLQAILAKQNSDIDIVDNSTGKHINKTKLGIYKVEDSHLIKLANLANNNTSGGGGQSNSEQKTTTTRGPIRDESSSHDTTTTTAIPMLNTEIIPMNEPIAPHRINSRGSNQNYQDDASSISIIKQPLIIQGQLHLKPESFANKPDVNQQHQQHHMMAARLSDRTPPVDKNQQLGIQANSKIQHYNRTPLVQIQPEINHSKFSNEQNLATQSDNSQQSARMNNHQHRLPIVSGNQQNQPVMLGQYEQKNSPIGQYQPHQTQFGHDVEQHKSRNNFPPRLPVPVNQQQYPRSIQPANIQQINRNHPEAQIFAQFNDQLVQSIRNVDSPFAKSMQVQSYPQMSSIIHDNLPIMDYDQDHASAFSSGYYLPDAM